LNCSKQSPSIRFHFWEEIKVRPKTLDFLFF
jgi:hypothetical protein